MMHPDTELRFINEHVGHGVVATRDIPMGTITWAQDELDRDFAPAEVDRLGPLFTKQLDKYCFRNQHGNWILCWDHARFVNHSFRSNCMTTTYNFEIAIRDIAAGEQLTDDYGYLNITRPFEAIDEGLDRTTVYPDDLTRYHARWDAQLAQAWPGIVAVAQPLRPLLGEPLWARVQRVASDQEPMASILTCYYDAQARANVQVGEQAGSPDAPAVRIGKDLDHGVLRRRARR